MQYITLNNGIKMPSIGLGTYGLKGQKGVKIMQNALQIGYRLFDTAQMYENEKEVGIALATQSLKDSNLQTKESRDFAHHITNTKYLDSSTTPISNPHKQSAHRESSEVSPNDLSRPLQRNELFITTKLSSNMPYKRAWQSIEQSLQNLGLEYVDLLVIHEPYANAKEMYKACEEAYHKGLIHAIGISNFYGRFLEDFLDSMRVKPVLNQVQAHIFFQQHTLQKFLESKGIHLQAWSPLACGRNGIFTNETLQNIAKAHHKSTAQIALKFLLDKGMSIIPKASSFEKLQENLTLFDFSLTQKEREILSRNLIGIKAFLAGTARASLLHKTRNYQSLATITHNKFKGYTMQKAGQKEHNLLQILQERFISLENVRTLAIDYDRELLGFLLENAEFRERFFTRIDSIAVFEKDKFLDFLKLRMLNKSYTAFSNKIGLQLESSFENTSKVVLNFPFKDCILKGGQSRDEKQKIKEIFFNEVLAKSEIDVLFSKKMLHNFELIECQDSKQPTQRNNSSSFSHCERSEAIHKKLDSSVDCHENLACHTEPLGEVSKNTESKLDFSPVSQAQNDETKHEATAKSQNDEKENAGLKECLSTSPSLLIKGNNLLALHSLKKKFANKVKLIYIDPPYNTGNDSFNYNDNFNHSTWLTFMKNRLEIARDFLRDDGVIFISIDEYESHYCKVLMDEIFGRDNFVGDFIRKTKSTTNDSKIGLNYQHEFLLCYAKNKNNVNLLGGQKDLSKYQNPDNDPFGAWVSDNPSAKSGDPKTGYFAVKNPYTGKEDYPPEGRFWLFSQNTIQRHIDEGRICFKKEHKDDERGFIYKRYLKDLKTTKKTFDSLKFVDNAFMNQVGTKEFVKLFGDSAVFKNPKPESLIYEILNHTTNENDLVMDFFAGSGTTLAVAHKMKRRFIGIEQMDYIESITKERLKKVVAGEQGGISKAVDWQGGGSFIYAELMPLNVAYKERIKNLACHTEPLGEVSKNVESTRDLHKDISLSLNMTSIEKELESKAFVDYRVDIQDMLKDKEFHALSLDEKLKVLYAILDSNMDYVLYDDIEDSEYGVSKELKELNRIFYGENDE